MQLEKTIEINAPQAKVWATLTDIQNWPLWTASMTRVERLGEAPFGLGSEARITQPKVPQLTWKVVEFEPGVSFSWQAATRGVKMLATHRIARSGEGQCTVTLSLKQSGPLAWLANLVAAGQTHRYVDMEAEGLKKYCETPT